jgi:hypothetical protein
MTNNILKEDVMNGDKAVFKVFNEKGEFVRYEILDYWGIIDLLIMCNGERILELATLYNYEEIKHNEETYKLVCGAPLIARLMVDVARDIIEDIADTPEVDEERYNDFERGNV